MPAAYEGTNFISHCDEGAIFHNPEFARDYFTLSKARHFTSKIADKNPEPIFGSECNPLLQRRLKQAPVSRCLFIICILCVSAY